MRWFARPPDPTRSLPRLWGRSWGRGLVQEEQGSAQGVPEARVPVPVPVRKQRVRVRALREAWVRALREAWVLAARVTPARVLVRERVRDCRRRRRRKPPVLQEWKAGRASRCFSGVSWF